MSDLIQTISWSGLENEISRRLGVEVSFSYGVNDFKGTEYITIKSETLVDKVPFLKVMFRDVYLLGEHHYLDNKKIIFSLEFRLEHKDGGRNGIPRFMNAQYLFETKSWEFSEE